MRLALKYIIGTTLLVLVAVVLGGLAQHYLSPAVLGPQLGYRHALVKFVKSIHQSFQGNFLSVLRPVDITILVSLVVGLLGAILMSLLMVRPLKRLLHITDNLAHGNREPIALSHRRDELGQLEDDLYDISGRMRKKDSQLIELFVAKIDELLGQAKEIDHEIRGLLQNESASLQVAQRNSLYKTQNAASHMRRYMLDLLQWERLGSNKELFNMARFNLNFALQDLTMTYLPLISDKNIRLNVALPLRETFVWGDQAKITDIIAILVENAIEKTDEGHVDVKVHKEDKFIIVEVSDTGRGVPPAVRPLLFKVETNGKNAGKGLSLAIANNIIDRIGGHMSYRTNPGGGSLFTFSLPTDPN